MSHRLNRQDSGKALLNIPNIGIQFASSAAAPTNGDVGYAPGCIWINTAAGAGAQHYRNDGTFASATWVQPTGGVNLSGLLATAAELNRSSQNSTRPVAVGAASLTVSQALHDGKTILLDTATGIAVTLPAMTGSGARYRFVVTATASGGNYVITATAANLFGGVTVNDDTGVGTLFTDRAATNAAGSTVITLDGTTRGGRKGDWFEIEDVASGIGMVRGHLNGSGTEATPFS